MTPAEHAALSSDLARALGWPWVDTFNEGKREPYVLVSESVDAFAPTADFDYRDPTVCLPLIEWLGKNYSTWVYPQDDDNEPPKFAYWEVRSPMLYGSRVLSTSGDIAEAVARAVIGLKGSSEHAK